jgi:Ca2+-transporting ATPase
MLTLEVAYSRPATEVARELSSDSHAGLSAHEAERRLAEIGPNELRQRAGPGYLRIAARQLADPLVLLLVAAAIVSAAIGEGIEAAVIAAIVVLNGVLGFVQEAGAERAVHALGEAIERVASVIRDGRESRIPARELVPGDLLVLREGDRVPADARVVRSERLEVDESALTGESIPVGKHAAPSGPRTPLAERTSMVFAGTGVTRGRAWALVTGTGDRTEIGRVAELAATAAPPPTPLQRTLGRLSRVMVLFGLAVTAVLTAGMLARGEPLHEAFLLGVSVAVAAVPEGLAATVTIALAQGARAMAARGAIVRRLSAVETVGGATVIAADKTGTLTVNQLRVAEIHPLPGTTERDVIEAGALASTAELVAENGRRRVVGDPVDGAFVLAALDAGSPDPRLAPGRRLVSIVPFDPNRKRLTAVYEEDGTHRLVVKGAPEALAGLARLDEASRAALESQALVWARTGLRVLAVGEKRLADAADAEPVDEDIELLGLVALHDPLREGAANSLRDARIAGIKVAMLTGDHPATAVSIASQLGLGRGDAVTGTAIDALQPNELAAAAGDNEVYARVTPEHKLRLVSAFQARGDVVAVTGDGINDAPALRQADVGIAMGEGGTEAAREASEIVLTNDDFATILAAVREGRRIEENMRRFVFFLLSANLGEVVLFAIAILAGIGVPLTIVQILVVNLLTDGLPAVALAQDPASADVMRRGPRRGSSLFTRDAYVALGVVGALVGLAATAAYLAGLAGSDDAAQTMAFATVAISELVVVWSIRSSHTPAWHGPPNPLLRTGVLVSAAVVVCAIYVPALQRACGTVSLSILELGIVLAFALVPSIVLETAKAVRRR